jgi:hypothetical protein
MIRPPLTADVVRARVLARLGARDTPPAGPAPPALGRAPVGAAVKRLARRLLRRHPGLGLAVLAPARAALAPLGCLRPVLAAHAGLERALDQLRDRLRRWRRLGRRPPRPRG